MITFDRREAAFEAAYAHQEDRRFRAHVRATRDLARGAAGQRGEDPLATKRYAEAILAMRLSAGDGAGITTRIVRDLARAGRAIERATVSAKADALLAAALHAGDPDSERPAPD